MVSVRSRGLLLSVRSAGFCALIVLAAHAVSADDVRPVQLQLREQEPGLFLAQWQVPQIIPVRAAPKPVLPQGCVAEGELSVREQPGTWVFRQAFRCPAGLEGQEVGIDFPFVNPNISTILRVELLSGESYAHLFPSGEEIWRLPEGTALGASLRDARNGVLFGIRHVFESFVHVALVVVFALLGSRVLVGGFLAGQLGALLCARLGLALTPSLAELGIALATVLLANEVLRPEANRRQVRALALAAGWVHGLGLFTLVPGELDIMPMVLAIVGMDATFVVLGALIGWAAARVDAWLRPAGYVVGVISVALGLSFFFAEPLASVEARLTSRLPALSGGVAESSRRVAPASADASVQSFVTIEAFETRHEILLRLRDLDASLGEAVEIEDQGRVKQRLAESIRDSASIIIDGRSRDAIIDRVDFVTVDRQGVLPRLTPVREIVDTAYIGITFAYPTPRTPRDLRLEWRGFSEAFATVPVTLVDPEATRQAELTPESPSITWENTLSEEPIPTVSGVPVEPTQVPIPLLSLPFIVGALWLAFKKRAFALARASLILGVLAGPLGMVALAVPSSSVPSPGGARRILASILPNVYRAFEFREESAAYDRLAVSVTGETLTEVYLEHRRALEMEERGGARARVEAVEVHAVESVEPSEQGGFGAVASWTVGGTVTHFGHRHFRENRYRALVSVVPVDDLFWKIRSIDMLQEERVR